MEGVSHPSADLTEVQGREQEEEKSRVTQRRLSCEDQDVSRLSQLCPWCKSATQPLASGEGTRDLRGAVQQQSTGRSISLDCSAVR